MRTKIEGERFLHRELWRAVGRQLEVAAQYPAGSFSDYLVAMTFAFHTLDRLRLRGLSGASDEFTLAAAVQNLRRLAKLIPKGSLAPGIGVPT
jgi:hypothetical protein